MVGLGNTPPNLPSQLKVRAEAPTQTCQGGFGMPANSCDSRGTLEDLCTPIPPWFALIPFCIAVNVYMSRLLTIGGAWMGLGGVPFVWGCLVRQKKQQKKNDDLRRKQTGWRMTQQQNIKRRKLVQSYHQEWSDGSSWNGKKKKKEGVKAQGAGMRRQRAQ